MGVGPLDRDAEQLPGEDVRGGIAAAHPGGPGRGERAVDPLRTAQAELAHVVLPRREADARRLGGDERLEIDQVEQRGLQELAEDDGAGHPEHGLLREHDRPFRHGVDVAAEGEIPEGVQKALLEERGAVVALQAREVFEVTFGKVEALDVLDGELEPAGHGEPAAEGGLAEEEVERRLLPVRARLPVGVGHGELVEIREERQRILVDAAENAQGEIPPIHERV
jgi:hypothetical protein